MTQQLVLIPPREVKLFRVQSRVTKRIIDIVICGLALPLLLPLLGVLAALVYFDNPGPIFFKQYRTGKGGKRFQMYKLRTMATNPEELKAKYAHLNELTWPDFKITDDPRVTRVGRILRKTSLDELPQIINVIKGEMSIVRGHVQLRLLPTRTSCGRRNDWKFCLGSRDCGKSTAAATWILTID